MNAIIQIGGKQYSVKENDIINVDRINAQKGETITLNQVLAIGNGEQIKFGSPYLPHASVKAEILDHFRDKKIIVFKMKRRKGYRRKQGHRQELTKIKITEISAS